MSRRLLLALALMLGALPAHATVREVPIKVRLVAPPVSEGPGRPLAGEFEVVTARAVDIANVRMEAAGAPVALSGAPVSDRLAARAAHRYRYELALSQTAAPVIVRLEVDGHPFEKRFDLSAKALERLSRPGALTEVRDATPGFPGLESLARPAVAASEARLPLRGPAEPLTGTDVLRSQLPLEAQQAVARNIRVRGRFAYRRDGGTLIGADGVQFKVFDEAGWFDGELAVGTTDAGGNYDVTFLWDPCFFCDAQPDLYVLFEAVNSKTRVETADFEVVYSWVTGTTNDYTGTNLDKGTVIPSDEDEHPALHIITDMTRNWRWYLNKEGIDMPPCDVQWPDGEEGAYYNPVFQEIHVSVDREWREDTHAHEYGHHYIQNFAVAVTPDYCNDICDDGPWPIECGHCMWCPETDHDAWAEGWPNWIAHVQTTSYAADYGIASANTRNQESVDECGATSALESALITEGFIGALLQDVWDSTGDDDPSISGTWTDRLSLGHDEIFDVVDLDHPTTPAEFFTKFRARFPSRTETLWETGKNCGYDFDTANPSIVSGLSSSSHAVSSTSTDATIAFTWTRATDDWSGVSGYSIIMAPVPGLPDQVTETGDVTSWTSAPLASGTWYMSIRTRDRAGRWSSSYRSAGPYTIQIPTPANLRPQAVAGWYRQLVVRDVADATSSSVPAPTTLDGNAATTYLNFRGVNNGGSATPAGFQSRFYVDGTWVWWASWGAAGAGNAYWANNQGALTVRGGRHSATVEVDALEEIAESSETDNAWGRQWNWSPLFLTAVTTASRPAPPARTGGWPEVVENGGWYNCDGLRFQSTGMWNAVLVNPGADHDVDARLHFASSSVDTGFMVHRASSARPAGCVDAVLANRRVVGNTLWDVGVIEGVTAAGPYTAEHLLSATFPWDDSTNVVLNTNRFMALREFFVDPANVGPVSITARVVSGTGPVWLAWYASDFGVGGLFDADAIVGTNGGETARLDVNIPTSGYNGVAIFRDPIYGTAPVTVVLEIGRTPPDFVPLQAAGWHAPFTPRPANDGTPSAVPLPDTLHGNANSTYLNIAVRNQGPTAASGLLGQVFLDGVYTWWLAYGNFPGGASSLFNWNAAWNVRGGRHTLGLLLDQVQQIEEIDETNNDYAEQYVWSPLALAGSTPVTRGAPPDVDGGWPEAAPVGTLWYNADGLRTPAIAPTADAQRFQGVAVMPVAGTDVDLRLHELKRGAKDGFKNHLGLSSWGVGQSDYVIANFNVTSPRAFDVGVLRYDATAGNYTAHAVQSLAKITPQGVYGPFTLAANRIVQLHELQLNAGVYDVHLENAGGSVDWGMTLHSALSSVSTKSMSIADGARWFAPAGADERMSVTVPSPGRYCLAVWKAGSADLALSGSYRLRIFNMVADAGDELVEQTRFGGVHPNPFHGGTQVSFDLAREAQAKVEVYDVRGAHVRTLSSGTLPAGRHQLTWNGADDDGRALPSGVYLVRFSAGGIEGRRKVVLTH